MNILPLRMSVHYMSVWCPRRPEEGIGSPGTGVTDDWESPCGCWESNPVPLVEQQVFLTAQLPLQPVLLTFK